MLTLSQAEKALNLAGWTPAELARQAALPDRAFLDWREGRAEPSSHAVEAMQAAFEAAGLAFSGEGVARGGAVDQAAISVENLTTDNDK